MATNPVSKKAEDRAGSQHPVEFRPDAAATSADVVKLTRLYSRAVAENVRLAAQADWLQKTLVALHVKRRWFWWFVPVGLLQRARLKRLERRGLFDGEAYRHANPDVLQADADPLRHYILHGLREGRSTGHESTNASPLSLVDDDTPAWIDRDADARRRILDSGMFDEEWYRARYSDLILDDRDPLGDYLGAIASDVLRDPGPLFSTAFYLEMNSDTRGVHPLVHFVEQGLNEGRRSFSPAKVNAFLDGAPTGTLERLSAFLDPERPTVILYWKEGNFFFNDIADYIAALLRRKGLEAQSLDSDAAVAPNTANVVVVAPHEYCVHGPGKSWSADQFASAIYVNTEQWHTSWFVLAYGIFRRSGKVLDINPAAAAGLALLDMRAGFLPLLPLRDTPLLFERAPLADDTLRLKAIRPLTYPIDFAQRPYDIVFLGVLNARRARALAMLAPTLAAHDCFLHAPRFSGPVRKNDPDMLSSGDFAQIAMNARILLNIHQGESHYFEWHRLFLSGVAQGCVVVTEPCTPTGNLEEGKHYLTAALEEMPALINRLLTTAEGRAQMQAIHESCNELLDEIEAGEGLAAVW